MYNLQKLLKEHIIEIPVIQRDYAQGRENSKVNRIRNGFVEALLMATSNPETCRLHLDFIYGKIESQSTQNVQENNYNHVESILAFAKAYTSQVKVGLSGKIPEVDREVLKASKTKMMPLDGQQRLTTLWLLYYVLYHQSSLTLPEWMQNFTYKTRKSSTSFVNSLISNNDLEKNSVYSVEIKKSKWFYKAWLQDPTVKGMLVTLDEIQKQLNEKLITISEVDIRNQELEGWIDNLVNNEKESAIQFSFLPLSDIDVDDDIYIKMNDRGKQLTDFEILKNDLLGYLQDLVVKKESDFTIDQYDEIAKNIDKKWHDSFWDEKGIESFNVEPTFHYYFLYYLLLYRLANRKSGDSVFSDYILTLIGDKRSDNFESFDFKELERLNLISLDSLKYVFDNLELLSETKFLSDAQEILDDMSFKKGDVPEIGEDFLKRFLQIDPGSIGYYDRTFNYAITSYLKIFKKDLDKELFKQWCRILQNLIYNQAYIQDTDSFEAAIKHVNILLDNGADIEETFMDKGNDLNVFPRQRLEEMSKVQLYKKTPELYNHFLNYERHAYFHGQIGFLIDMSRNEDNMSIDIEELNKYGKKLEKIFEPDNLNDNNFLIARALLTEKNYFHNKGSNRWQFYSNNNALRNKQEDWRSLFDNTEKRDKLKTLLNKISVENWKQDLNKIIDYYQSQNWKYYFVKEPKLWKLGKNSLLRKISNDNVRLWKTSRGYGEQYELRTKYLEYNWNRDLKPFEELKYHSVNVEKEHPCCYFTGWNNSSFKYHLDVRYIDGKYVIKFLNVDESSKNDIEQKVIDALILLQFKSDNQKGYIFNVITKGDENADEIMHLKLVEILSVLKNLKL
jgi:hypothetical protein